MATGTVKRLKDYARPDFRIPHVTLTLHVDATQTRVTASYEVIFDRAAGNRLVLNGEHQPNAAKQVQRVTSIRMNGVEASPTIEQGDYIIDDLPQTVRVEIDNIINPTANTDLAGLYISGSILCTQCEPHGFRRITLFPDRPDVMATYTTTLIGDKKLFPVLLCNGNPSLPKDLGNGMHSIVWDDPKPKPSYLFALVAGDLAHIEDHFVTRSGRRVTLRVYTDHGAEQRCHHAMASLKKSMAWDETRFNREYDMDVFNIVAVADFNFGAMENTTLNIFNSALALADPATATDADYFSIERVIAHEFFHHWSGNRVTLCNWFQLTLKEGLTVFRDQYFSADLHSAPVVRMDVVNHLRDAQFAEDAGAMAHPIRPEEYVEMDNFYTMTVYEKGAEVIRMYYTILGHDAFHTAMDLYFKKYEGQAVSCDDFLTTMQDSSGVDLSQFRLWYSQSGTPTVRARGVHDAAAHTYTLTLSQSRPLTRGHREAPPLHIPVRVGLIGADGQEIKDSAKTLHLKKAEEHFVFHHVTRRPVPSLLRNFSAPVILDSGLSDDDLRFLMVHDTDPFTQWDAGQTYAANTLLALIDAHQHKRPLILDEAFTAAFVAVLRNTRLDENFRAQMMTLPSESELANQMPVVDPDAIHAARTFVRGALARALRQDAERIVRAHDSTQPYVFDAAHMGTRALVAVCWRYLATLNEPAIADAALAQFSAARNMTDRLMALHTLEAMNATALPAALDTFYQDVKSDGLVLNKWFSLQAGTSHPDALSRVRALVQHPDFTLKNPNRARSVLGVFGRNQVHFHRADGAGYAFMADMILAVDQVNSKVAARIIAPFLQMKRFDSARQALMRTQLERLRAAPTTSTGVNELIGKILS